MAMGKRKHEELRGMWLAVSELPRSVSHPFYEKLNGLLAEHEFDYFVETQCRSFYAEKMGRPSLAPGQYFRFILLGYFECLDSERAMAWRAADSVGVRGFLGVALTEAAPDHSTISRTRRLIDLETHRTVFTWVLQCLGIAGLIKGKTLAIDATTLHVSQMLGELLGVTGPRAGAGRLCALPGMDRRLSAGG